MEAREGYKKTKLGWIPVEWDVVKMGSFTKSISKKNISVDISQVVSVTKYNGIVDSLGYFKKQVYSKDLSTYKIICRNQFAYATIHLDEGSIGVLTSYDKAVLSPMYTVFETDEGLVDVYFLLCLLKSKRLMDLYQHIGSGSINRRKSISYSTFSSIDVSLPPLPEQQKIAEILTTVDDKIASIENRIQQTEQLKKGLMEKLLNEGIGHTEFKDTKIGRIPASWDGLCVGNLVAFSGGSQPPRKTFIFEPRDGYVRLIQIRDYKTDRFKTYIPENMARKFCSKDDIMIGRYGPPIFQILRGIEGAYNVALIKAMPQNGIDKNYLWYFLNQRKLFYFIENLSQRSSGQTGVDLERLKSYPLPFPPKEEQKQITSILSAVDDKLDVLQSKKANYETLKKGLMEQLLTGKMRVKP